jgi:ketosteroid isomerase-like protein
MNRRHAAELLGRLHRAQGRFYAGVGGDELRELLSERVTWSVPGENAIAGYYEGIDAVMGYFCRRRDLARRSLRLHPRDLLTGVGEMAASITEGSAILEGREQRWSTVGLYRLGLHRVQACWLLPLDQAAFDRIWAAAE